MRALWISAPVVCLSFALAGEPPPVPAPPAPVAAKATEMQKAAEEFRLQTRNLGLRPDSPASVRAKNHPAVKLHGRLFENFRNDFLDAVPHEIRQRGQSKSLLRRNQFGFNVGGPVVIPRLFNGGRSTFFSISYEGVRERISRSTLRTIPTLGERDGDFSSTVDLSGNSLPVYDPASTRLNPSFDASQPVSPTNLQYLRDPFPENRIPVHRLDDVARRAAHLYPEPNASVGPFFRNNYFAVSPETNTANGMLAKVDHSWQNRHRLDFSTGFSNGFAGSARIFPTAADPSPPDRSFASRKGGLRHTWTVSPRTVNVLDFEATTDSSRSNAEAVPVYRVAPYTTMGRENAVSHRARNSFSFGQSLSRRVGQHSLTLASGLVRQELNVFTDASPLGSFRFGSGLTSLPGIVNTGHSFASFLLGLPDQVERSVITSPSWFRRSAFNIAATDHWELHRGLTISASLNFEVNTPRTEKYDRQSTIDLSRMNPANGRPGALVVAGRNGVPRGFQPVRCNFEPAAGLVWNPFGSTRTIVRTSYSHSTGSYTLLGSQFGTQAFNAYPTYISPNSQLEPALILQKGLPPAPPLPDFLPDAVNNTVADLIDRTDRQPQTQAVSLALEREITGSLVVTAGYYHYDGENMLAGSTGVNVNGIPLDALVYRDQLNDESFRRSLRPYPQYLGFDVNNQYPIGRYARDAGYLRVEKRTSGGLGLSAYSEWVKQMDDYSGPYGVQDPYNRDSEWSRTAGLPPLRLTVSYVYELPIGPSKPFLPWSDWRRYFVEGWSVSGMTSIMSGDPLYLRPQFNNTGGVIDALRVDVVPGVDPRVPSPGPDMWFNPAAFVQPPDFTPGNGPRTHPFLLQPGNQNNDLSVTKRFTLDADHAVELSAVGFNFMNHANWNDPDNVIGSASSPNVNAGRIIGSRGSRVIQLGIRYSF